MYMKYAQSSSLSFVIAFLSLCTALVLSTTIAYAATTGSLKVTTAVQNGPATPSSFTLQIKVGNSTVSASGNSLTFSGLPAGTHTITKTAGPAGYNVVWGGDCTSQGTFMIIPNLLTQCTATFVLGSVGTLKVNTVINGGTAMQSDFTVHLKKSNEPDTGSPSGSGSTVTFNNLIPGSYSVIQSPPLDGYTLTWSDACNSQGTVTVVGDRTVICTITHTFSSHNSGGSGRTDRTPVVRPGR